MHSGKMRSMWIGDKLADKLNNMSNIWCYHSKVHKIPNQSTIHGGITKMRSFGVTVFSIQFRGSFSNSVVSQMSQDNDIFYIFFLMQEYTTRRSSELKAKKIRKRTQIFHMKHLEEIGFQSINFLFIISCDDYIINI